MESQRVAGFGLVGAGAAVLAGLHVAEPSVDPLYGMLSDYALTPLGAFFGTAILLVAAGSMLLLPWRTSGPGARAGFAAWCVGLTVVAFFRRDHPGAPSTAIGDIHLVGSLTALVGLPLGAWAGGQRRLLTAACFALLPVAIVTYVAAEPVHDVAGVAERLLAVAEALLVVLTRPAPAGAGVDVVLTRPAPAGAGVDPAAAGSLGPAGASAMLGSADAALNAVADVLTPMSAEAAPNPASLHSAGVSHSAAAVSHSAAAGEPDATALG